jgi:hypothetical protein
VDVSAKAGHRLFSPIPPRKYLCAADRNKSGLLLQQGM